jgi:hypothetical protein
MSPRGLIDTYEYFERTFCLHFCNFGTYGQNKGIIFQKSVTLMFTVCDLYSLFEACVHCQKQCGESETLIYY